ncbi:HEPN domain-containing protein [Candidatus Aminicenantes bacterium AH-873-B07]|jgi:HEPN domain-containing protein|nr:HEPN domain-containing protein [Candidatus Aminicenantes bacterium AH-873-B07]
MQAKYKPPEEWFKQAEYDFDTAEIIFKNKRYIYTVFMCHLAIEKALKGLYAKKFKKDPPKIHNLNYFCEKLKINLENDLLDFVDNLNDLSIPTRYPDELDRLLKNYKKHDTEGVLKRTKELLLCLKKML